MIYGRIFSICKLSDMRDSYNLLSGKGLLIQMNLWGEKNGCQQKGVTVGEAAVGREMKVKIKPQRPGFRNRPWKTSGWSAKTRTLY